MGLRLGAGITVRDEQIALVTDTDVSALLEIVEEGDALADELDLLRVVELKPEGPGRYRSRQRRQRGALFENDRPQSGTLREKRRGATDDAPADNDEVGAFGR